jgi:hypothetical protein
MSGVDLPTVTEGAGGRGEALRYTHIYIYIYVIVCVGDGGAASCYMKLNDVDAGAWRRMEAFAKMRILSGP